MERSDSIIRKLLLPAPPASVWQRSFASPEALASWFPDRVEGEFRLGGTFWLVWGEHRCEARLVAFDPEVQLAYQWHPGDAHALADLPEAELTTVRFTLEAEGEHTRVTMVESGFENIAPERRGKALGENSNGWDEELGKLLHGR